MTTAACLPSVLTGCGRWPPTTRSPPGWTSTAAASSSECARRTPVRRSTDRSGPRPARGRLRVRGRLGCPSPWGQPSDHGLRPLRGLGLGHPLDALRELGAELRVRPGVQPPTVDAHLLHDSVVTTWRTIAGDIDVLVGIPSGPQAGLNRSDSHRG